MKSLIFLLLCGLVVVQLSRPQPYVMNAQEIEYQTCLHHHLCNCSGKSYNRMKFCSGKLGEEGLKTIAYEWNNSGVLSSVIDYRNDTSFRELICPLSDLDKRKGFAEALISMRKNMEFWTNNDFPEQVMGFMNYKRCLQPLLKFCENHPGECMRRH